MDIHAGRGRAEGDAGGLDGEMRRISAFLDIPVDEARWPQIVEHCTFDYMKAHAQYSAPLGGSLWEGGATTFINKGTNGRWTDLLAESDIRAYQERARAELGGDCARCSRPETCPGRNLRPICLGDVCFPTQS